MKKQELSKEEKKAIKKKNIIMDLIISIILIGGTCLGIFLWKAGIFTSKEVQVLEGNYKLVQMKTEDETTNKEDIERLKNVGLDMTLTISKNGTGKLNMYKEEANLNFDKNNVKYGTDTMPYTYENNLLSFSQNGVTLTFEKVQNN